ncbi:hypothetical protein F2Q69_00017435 [Brassica cretica]|uniref:Uncharacterized protein n=1 Tax=Brassica cretica TaxID=69181 RepID=A0A8S9QWQ2_BRACR|nr:hypothetical protein F2Q69_00017435 [Brassica cretica]
MDVPPPRQRENNKQRLHVNDKLHQLSPFDSGNAEVSVHFKGEKTEFKQRPDRHGKPFGERVSFNPPRGLPLRNKITPAMTTDRGNYEGIRRGPPLRNSYTSTSPAQPLFRGNILKPHREAELEYPVQHRPPLERNLDIVDFSLSLPPVPSTEEVMEELREATLQYTMCADPTESAARRQRVLQSDASGLMEETAASIIKMARTAQILAAQANVANAANLAMTEERHGLQMGTIATTTTEKQTSTYILLPPEHEAPQSAPTQPTRRRGRQTKTNPRDLHISPKLDKPRQVYPRQAEL